MDLCNPLPCADCSEHIVMAMLNNLNLKPLEHPVYPLYDTFYSFDRDLLDINAYHAICYELTHNSALVSIVPTIAAALSVELKLSNLASHNATNINTEIMCAQRIVSIPFS